MRAPVTTPRPPLWRDVRILRIAFQVGVLVGIGALIAYLYDNLQSNLRRQGISTTFDFLDQPAGFTIAYSDFRSSDTIRNALLVGMRNTLTIAIVGILLTLILGTLVGIARLSSNWVVRKMAGTYVETARNIPPLLLIFLVHTAFLTNLPQIESATTLNLPGLGDVLLLSNRQSAVMSFRDGGDLGTFLVVLAVALAGALVLRAFLQRREDRTGQPQHGVFWGMVLVLGVGILAYQLLGGPLELSNPEATGRRITGGMAMGLAFVSVLVALVLYTATHVAEIVRGSILAVPKGQVEAATSVGLSSAQRLRYVILPQAFRIATPPIINQFLNLAKNTSLGLAVAYSEAMYVTRTVIGNGQPAIQSFLVIMAFYLVLSLAISLVSNVVNSRLQLVER